MRYNYKVQILVKSQIKIWRRRLWEREEKYGIQYLTLQLCPSQLSTPFIAALITLWTLFEVQKLTVIPICNVELYQFCNSNTFLGVFECRIQILYFKGYHYYHMLYLNSSFVTFCVFSFKYMRNIRIKVFFIFIFSLIQYLLLIIFLIN